MINPDRIVEMSYSAVVGLKSPNDCRKLFISKKPELWPAQPSILEVQFTNYNKPQPL